MPTFIDESGDTGPPKQGGSLYFRLAAVWMPSLGDVERFRESIRSLRLELGLPVEFEFKYAKTHRDQDLRNAFFRSALTLHFRFAVSSIDKRDGYWVSASRHEQHWACATELAATLRSTYHQADDQRGSPLKELVIVDDNGDRDFLATIKRQFRGLRSKHQHGPSMIGRVAFRTSQADEMLQLVDMICGACGPIFDGGDRTSYDQIADRRLG
jgi:hypothetical protein